MRWTLALGLLLGCGKAAPPPESAADAVPRTAPAALETSPDLAPAPVCGPDEAWGLRAPTPLLGDRYTLCLPAQVEARPADAPIMGARPDPSTRTVVGWAEPAGRAAYLHAEDLVRVGGEDWQDEAEAWITTTFPDVRLERRTLPSGIEAVVATRAAPASSDRDNLRLAAMLQHPDGTLQWLGLFDADATDPGPSPAQARSLLDSLAPTGLGRPMGGTRRLPTGPAGQELQVELPPHAVVLTRRGPDFVVHELIDLGDPSGPQAVGLYFGGHPNLGGTDITRGASGTLLGREASFVERQAEGQVDGDRKPELGRNREDGGTSTVRVQIDALLHLTGPTSLDLPAPEGTAMRVGRSGWYVHLFARGTRPGLEPLLEAAASATWPAQPQDEPRKQ